MKLQLTEQHLRNNLNGQCYRHGRPHFNMISWHDGTVKDTNRGRESTVLAKLTDWHKNNNTTRGITPGLKDPTQPRSANNWVSLPTFRKGSGLCSGRRQASRAVLAVASVQLVAPVQAIAPAQAMADIQPATHVRDTACSSHKRKAPEISSNSGADQDFAAGSLNHDLAASLKVPRQKRTKTEASDSDPILRRGFKSRADATTATKAAGPVFHAMNHISFDTQATGTIMESNQDLHARSKDRVPKRARESDEIGGDIRSAKRYCGNDSRNVMTQNDNDSFLGHSYPAKFTDQTSGPHVNTSTALDSGAFNNVSSLNAVGSVPVRLNDELYSRRYNASPIREPSARGSTHLVNAPSGLDPKAFHDGTALFGASSMTEDPTAGYYSHPYETFSAYEPAAQNSDYRANAPSTLNSGKSYNSPNVLQADSGRDAVSSLPYSRPYSTLSAGTSMGREQLSGYESRQRYDSAFGVSGPYPEGEDHQTHRRSNWSARGSFYDNTQHYSTPQTRRSNDSASMMNNDIPLDPASMNVYTNPSQNVDARSAGVSAYGWTMNGTQYMNDLEPQGDEFPNSYGYPGVGTPYRTGLEHYDDPVITVSTGVYNSESFAAGEIGSRAGNSTNQNSQEFVGDLAPQQFSIPYGTEATFPEEDWEQFIMYPDAEKKSAMNANGGG